MSSCGFAACRQRAVNRTNTLLGSTKVAKPPRKSVIARSNFLATMPWAPDTKRAQAFWLDLHVLKGKRVNGRSQSGNDGRFFFKLNQPRSWLGLAHTLVKTARPEQCSLPREVAVGPTILPQMQRVTITCYLLCCGDEGTAGEQRYRDYLLDLEEVQAPVRIAQLCGEGG